jgi:hypothetical protein
LPDLEVQTIKIQIKMKKEKNLNEPQQQALNIPDVSKREIKTIWEMINDVFDKQNGVAYWSLHKD